MSPLQMQQLGEAMALAMKLCVVTSAVFALVGYLVAAMLVSFVRPWLVAFERAQLRKWIRSRRAAERQESGA